MLPSMRYLKKSGALRGGVQQRLLMYYYDVRIMISSVLMILAVEHWQISME